MTISAKRYEWDQTYRLAVLETDPRQVMPRVVAAKSAIEARRIELNSTGVSHTGELQSINSALKILELLTHEVREKHDFSE
jgi:hypothetical protein